MIVKLNLQVELDSDWWQQILHVILPLEHMGCKSPQQDGQFYAVLISYINFAEQRGLTNKSAGV